MFRFSRSSIAQNRAFTILELLVGAAIFVLLLALLLGVISQTGSLWQRARNDAESFQSARFAFNLITRTLSQATLMPYGDYDNPASPTRYLRKSDLHFVIAPPPGTNFGQGNSVFFQAKLGDSPEATGLGDLLNAVGYYVTYGKNPKLPAFLTAFDRNRFRLMQYLQPSESLKVFETSDDSWFTNDLAVHSEVVADNIILLLFWPRLAESEDPTGSNLTTTYRYDSRANATANPQPITANQQPPLVQVTLVAIDENTADRLDDSSTPPAKITAALTGLFAQSDAATYADDLAKLETRLSQTGIPYRVFNSLVPLRESQWTK
jgi:uncharacterized protein (TIGR02599 family)